MFIDVVDDRTACLLAGANAAVCVAAASMAVATVKRKIILTE